MKVYLETSFVSACVTSRTDPKSIYRRDTSREWWTSQRKHHDLFISPEVTLELSNPAFKNSADAIAWVSGIPSLPLTSEVVDLAERLIQERVMPQTLSGDAIHVAAATIHAIPYILSWNVRHLANPNKRQHLRKVLMTIGRIAPEIVTPDLLWTT